jgi:hypothetical protein
VDDIERIERSGFEVALAGPFAQPWQPAALGERFSIDVGRRAGRRRRLVRELDEDDAGYCTVSGWAPSGPDLVVSVTCWHEEEGEPDPDAFYLFVIQ